jgi:hypothetical protein
MHPIVLPNKIFSIFLGWCIANDSYYQSIPKDYKNGNIRGISKIITIVKYEKMPLRKEIESTIKSMGFHPQLSNQSISFSSDMYYEIISQIGHAYHKSIPDNLWNDIDRKECYFGMYPCDGDRSRNRYSTMSNRLKDQLKIILFEMGYSYHSSYDGCNRIITERKENKTIEKAKKIMTDFRTSHCITLDRNHTVYAGRNDTFTWVGQSGYGAARSPIFEQVHTPNCGWDCCSLGQQIQEYTEKRMREFGFETIYGDTDSIMVLANDGIDNSEEYVRQCLKTIVDEIMANVPFKVKTFKIDIEGFLHYVMWPFSLQPIVLPDGTNKKEGNRLVKERKGKKKNYVYIYDKKGEKTIKIMGLPIIKDNATALDQKILEKNLKPMILDGMSAKFSKEKIKEILQNYLDNEENLGLLAVQYRVKEVENYKNPSQIQAQISQGYFNGGAGVINLIKNNRIGKAGKGKKYCTIEEAKEHKLTIDDFDLTKINNELAPFIKG